jgi:hypothetical protein
MVEEKGAVGCGDQDEDQGGIGLSSTRRHPLRRKLSLFQIFVKGVTTDQLRLFQVFHMQLFRF